MKWKKGRPIEDGYYVVCYMPWARPENKRGLQVVEIKDGKTYSYDGGCRRALVDYGPGDFWKKFAVAYRKADIKEEDLQKL